MSLCLKTLTLGKNLQTIINDLSVSKFGGPRICNNNVLDISQNFVENNFIKRKKAML